MQITYDEQGWSQVLEYEGKLPPDASSVLNSSNYHPMLGATWFTNTYWNRWRWARSYRNNTNRAQTLTRCSFRSCTAHSNGLPFKSSNNVTHRVRGGGCSFYCEIFHSSGYLAATSNIAPLPAIHKCNASYKGQIGVVHSGQGTIFGAVPPWPEGSKDDYGNYIVSQPIEFTFDREVTINPGESIFFIINVPKNSWNFNGATEGVIVIENVNTDPSNWDSDIDTKPKDLIWVMTNEGWKQERSPFQWDGHNWIKMEG